MNSQNFELLYGFAGTLLIVVLLFVIFRGFTLWYFKIDTIVDLLTKIELNMRQVAVNSENVVYDEDGILITNRRLVVPPNEWAVKMLKPVHVEGGNGKFVIRLFNARGEQVHFLKSDDSERASEVVAAINNAIALP